MTTKPVILTGDRTTGPLHIGHYAGSLRNRLRFQDSHEQFLLLADTQALTDHAHNPEKVRRSVMEVALDYLAVGIDPGKSTICLQSHLPALAELSMLYLNFVTVARLERNPTIKDEIRMRGFPASRDDDLRAPFGGSYKRRELRLRFCNADLQGLHSEGGKDRRDAGLHLVRISDGDAPDLCPAPPKRAGMVRMPVKPFIRLVGVDQPGQVGGIGLCHVMHARHAVIQRGMMRHDDRTPRK
nr:hypothetical protein [Roseovarius sp. M141]